MLRTNTHTQNLLGYSHPKFALAKVIWASIVMYVLFCIACYAAQKPPVFLAPQVSLLSTSITVAATVGASDSAFLLNRGSGAVE